MQRRVRCLGHLFLAELPSVRQHVLFTQVTTLGTSDLLFLAERDESTVPAQTYKRLSTVGVLGLLILYCLWLVALDLLVQVVEDEHFRLVELVKQPLTTFALVLLTFARRT